MFWSVVIVLGEYLRKNQMYKICELRDSRLEFCFALSAPGVSLDRALCCVPGCSSQSVSVDDKKNWAGKEQGLGEKGEVGF